jgi:hypothetical protein
LQRKAKKQKSRGVVDTNVLVAGISESTLLDVISPANKTEPDGSGVVLAAPSKLPDSEILFG